MRCLSGIRKNYEYSYKYSTITVITLVCFTSSLYLKRKSKISRTKCKRLRTIIKRVFHNGKDKDILERNIKPYLLLLSHDFYLQNKNVGTNEVRQKVRKCTFF